MIYFAGKFIKEIKAFTEIEKGKSVIKVKCGFNIIFRTPIL